jgi:biopolymer transport protein ExbD
MTAAGSDSADINLTPLLDLVLQLIMFFMITVNFVRVDQINEEIALPIAQSAVPLDQTAEDYVFLNLNKEGKLVGSADDLDTPEKIKNHLNREKESLERLARAKGKTGEVKIIVVLRAHKEARYRDVWHVLQQCQNAGYRKWQVRVITKVA